MNLREAYDPFRAIGGAWRLLTTATLTLLVGGILLVLTEGGVKYNYPWIDDGSHSDEESAARIVFGCVCCLLGIAFFLFNSLLHVGFATAVERVMRSGEQRFKDLFQSRDRWLGMIFTQILLAILAILSALVAVGLCAGALFLGAAIGDQVLGALFLSLMAIPCVILWIFLMLGISLATSAVAIESMSPLDALGRSWSLVRGNRLWLLWYFVVSRIFSAIGFCCCFLPGLLTAPLVSIADYEAYIRLVRGTEGWWIEEPRRPPESPFDDPTGPAA